MGSIRPQNKKVIKILFNEVLYCTNHKYLVSELQVFLSNGTILGTEEVKIGTEIIILFVFLSFVCNVLWDVNNRSSKGQVQHG